MLMVDELTPHAERVLSLIRTHSGEWLTRREISRLMGKDRPNPWDFHVLQLLVDEGLIEVRKVDIPSPIGHQFEYRAI